ncbi:MAG: O-antigen ligase family protein [Candidatus Pacebacteria bacterium]|jgi:O-antigen ligase|nr:O-antigen ligase family protein [Candidatus Paceibacterota bacterium]MBT4004729.1 O-antigen ligase family protein [Candidatus Paceibacterota bacterium]MBT6899280.1 O-antigen ligase family protein [Candidatus Paceibacterota bacterium]MBT7184180.1 O-antigen ligase family protein [Candidatus Paceibacterota bacterium]MBT7309988.1 O-antigen ligase family protein [Candidatus Paceibacterota bacterium]
MSLNIKQIVFYLLFLLSLLFSLLLGESYLGYLLLGGVSLPLLLFSSELDWKKINHFSWLVIFWLLALFGVILSSFFSINLPLSLNYATRFIFGFLIFWFFLLVKKSFISAQQIIKGLLLISSVVLLISIGFQFFPNLANLLPGMNLLHATYGHNHLAALLLLVIPLSWWLASECVRDGQSQLWWLIPLGFSLGLLFSFGRVAVAVGLVQFLAIYWQLKKNNLIKNIQLRFLLRTLMSLFSIILLSNVFFSTATLINPEFTCPIPSLGKQLCKSISTEYRPEYWRWAVEITRDNFLLGSGPGTFGLAAQKYHLDPFGGSAHAHNAFLESLAGMGLIGGGFFISLMFFLLFLAAKNLGKIKKWDWRMATFLGVVAIYVDVFLDFDWDFIGIFSITLILLALIIKDKNTDPVRIYLSNFFRTAYFILALIAISLAGIYLKTDSLIKANKNQQAFQLFPYFHWHRKIYETSSVLDIEDRQKFYGIYDAQSAVYPTRILEAKDDFHRQQIKERWFDLNPWILVEQDFISYYLEQNNFDQAAKWLQKEQLLHALSQDRGYDLAFKNWQGEDRAVKYKDQYEIAHKFIEGFLLDEDWNSLRKASSIFNWDKYGYQPRFELIMQISIAADGLVMQKDYSQALHLTQSMNLILPKDYWIMSQLGNLAAASKDFDKSKQLYSQCRIDFKLQSGEDHLGCRDGIELLTSLDGGEIESQQVVSQAIDRYREVSQIIRGEAVWQDFIE